MGQRIRHKVLHASSLKESTDLKVLTLPFEQLKQLVIVNSALVEGLNS